MNNSIYASGGSSLQPPNNPPREAKYVETRDLVEKLSSLITWCESTIIEANETLTKISEITPTLDKNSEEYKKLMTFDSALKNELERTNDDEKISLAEIHYLASEKLDYLLDKSSIAQSEFNRINENILRWNG